MVRCGVQFKESGILVDWALDLWCGFSGTDDLYINPGNNKLCFCGSFDISGSGILFYHICRYLNGLLIVSTEFYYNWN